MIQTATDTSGPGIPCEELYVGDPQGFGHRLNYAIRAEDLYCTKVLLIQAIDIYFFSSTLIVWSLVIHVNRANRNKISPTCYLTWMWNLAV